MSATAEPAAAGPLHLHLDALGGLAGDMFIAALLDARPELEAPARALAQVIGPGLDLRCEAARDGGIRGTRIRFAVADGGHGPHHYREYAALVAGAAPDTGARARALDILRRLGEAEAHVHGIPLEEVHFHEVADWDSVADILLAAWALERLGIASASAAPLPLGSGRVRTAHGVMPVPAPATAELLRGAPVIDDGIPGERVTPTGAAILAHLGPGSGLPPGPCRLVAAGYGFGHRTLPGIANALRATLFVPAGATNGCSNGEAVGVVAFAVDDQTPEDLAVGLDRVRAADGVLDVLQLPAFGKKGRMTASIEVLCRPEKLEKVARLCLAETATLGVRLREERRLILPREAQERGGIRLKRTRRPDGSETVKAEMDDVSDAGDFAARARRRAEAESLTRNETGESVAD